MAPSENRNFKEEDDDDEEEYAYDALDSESAPDSLTGGVDSSHHPAADGDSTRDHEETESLRAVGLELAPGSLAQFQTQNQLLGDFRILRLHVDFDSDGLTDEALATLRTTPSEDAGGRGLDSQVASVREVDGATDDDSGNAARPPGGASQPSEGGDRSREEQESSPRPVPPMPLFPANAGVGEAALVFSTIDAGAGHDHAVDHSLAGLFPYAFPLGAMPAPFGDNAARPPLLMAAPADHDGEDGDAYDAMELAGVVELPDAGLVPAPFDDTAALPPLLVAVPAEHSVQDGDDLNDVEIDGVAMLPDAGQPDHPRFEPTDEERAEATTNRQVDHLDAWYRRLNELDIYRAEYGHVDVPQVFPTNQPLANWVAKQRRERTKGRLSFRRISLLDSLGFDWGIRRGEAAWEARYAELQTFFSLHGHSNVLTRSGDNRALGRWVTEQRRQYRRLEAGQLEVDEAALMHERIPRLEALQFRWALQGVAGAGARAGGGDTEGAGDAQDEAVENFDPMEEEEDEDLDDEDEEDGKRTASV